MMFFIFPRLFFSIWKSTPRSFSRSTRQNYFILRGMQGAWREKGRKKSSAKINCTFSSCDLFQQRKQRISPTWQQKKTKGTKKNHGSGYQKKDSRVPKKNTRARLPKQTIVSVPKKTMPIIVSAKSNYILAKSVQRQNLIIFLYK